MIAALVVAILFSCGAVYNLLTGDWSNAAAGLAIAALLGGLHLSASRAAAQRERMLHWLHDHEHEIRAGGARLDGVMVTPRTRFREMSLCVSVLVMTFRVPSRLLLENRDSVVGTALGWSLLTLLLGWWGLPWGPIFTLQALGRNLTGGRAIDVETLLGPAPAAR